jgi:hypothetical protein
MSYNMQAFTNTSGREVMIETPEQYKARLAAYVEGKDPIAMQRQTPRTLAQLIEGIPETNIRLRPCARQVVRD